jgi:hypothetical protein
MTMFSLAVVVAGMIRTSVFVAVALSAALSDF